MNTLLQDIRYALRTLIKIPGVLAVAVLTLALGIGANTALFTVIHSVLLSSLPVKDPQELVFLTDPNSHGMNIGSSEGARDLLTYHESQQLRARNEVFSGLLAADSSTIGRDVAVEGSEPAQARILMVSGDYFSVLGVTPLLGRTFANRVDDVRDANPVAVVSYSFWKSRLGGDRAAIGRRIQIQRTSFDIIGVMPPGFFGETVGAAPDIWVPLTMQSEIIPGRDFLKEEDNPLEKTEWLTVIGRLKPGVTLAQAKASINVTFQQILQSQIGSKMAEKDRRDFLNQHLAVTPGGHGASTLRENFGQPLLILMAVVGLVLLIACANVANLLLARAAARQKEIAVRVALGAGRVRLFRQLLTESVLLGLAGGVLGLLLAQWADTGLLRLVSADAVPVPLDIHPSTVILAFTLGLSLLTAIFFGVAPALRASQIDLNSVLKGTARGVVRGTGDRGRFSMGKLLVVGQVALSLLLLIVAGLFVHSFAKLTEAKLGYDSDHLLLFRVFHTEAGYHGSAATQLYQNMLERIRAVPGVRAAAISKNGLFSHSESQDPISIEGYSPKQGQEMHARFDEVGAHYFSTVGIPVLLGREIGPQDEGNGQRVGVINQTMARYYFGDESPIGRRIWDEFPTTHTDVIVVGVAADAKYNSVREKTPRRFYIPYFHPFEEPSMATMVVRFAGDSASVVSGIREAVKQTSNSLPPPQIHTMNELVGQSLTRDRMITKLSGFFGVLGLVLACIGIYGVMTYAVAGRINEIGIRMALGARAVDVLWLIMRESLMLVVIGAAIGLPAVIGAGKIISSLLFGLTPLDPMALSLATAFMFAVAALAGYIPARRAARTDPLIALQYE